MRNQGGSMRTLQIKWENAHGKKEYARTETVHTGHSVVVGVQPSFVVECGMMDDELN